MSFKVCKHVIVEQLEDLLNRSAEKGYEIFKIFQESSYSFTVILQKKL